MYFYCHEFITHVDIVEETLIDFCELSGEHSGENMCEEVWDCLTNYSLEGRVDTASNDSLISAQLMNLSIRL